MGEEKEIKFNQILLKSDLSNVKEVNLIIVMEKETKFFSAPCKENKCVKCCDPVLIHPKSSVKDGNLPKDKDGKDIWIKREGERWLPFDTVDPPYLAAYDCVYLDKEKKECNAYDKRPEICKTTSCKKGDLTYERVQSQRYLKKYAPEE